MTEKVLIEVAKNSAETLTLREERQKKRLEKIFAALEVLERERLYCETHEQEKIKQTKKNAGDRTMRMLNGGMTAIQNEAALHQQIYHRISALIDVLASLEVDLPAFCVLTGKEWEREL